jgi:hypothetical protein
VSSRDCCLFLLVHVITSSFHSDLLCFPCLCYLSFGKQLLSEMSPPSFYFMFFLHFIEFHPASTFKFICSPLASHFSTQEINKDDPVQISVLFGQV